MGKQLDDQVGEHGLEISTLRGRRHIVRRRDRVVMELKDDKIERRRAMARRKRRWDEGKEQCQRWPRGEAVCSVCPVPKMAIHLEMPRFPPPQLVVNCRYLHPDPLNCPPYGPVPRRPSFLFLNLGIILLKAENSFRHFESELHLLLRRRRVV